MLLRIAAMVILTIQESPAASTSMTFLPPKDAKPADVEKAAKAIEKRCAEYGYKGVTAKVAGSKEAPEVEVACATGITARMKPWLLHFTSLAASLVEIRVEYPLYGGERQQYEPGKSGPPGTTWFSVMRNPAMASGPNRDGSYGYPADRDQLLVRDEPKIDATGIFKWVRKGLDGPVYFEITGKAAKALKDLPDKLRVNQQLLVNGQLVLCGGALLKFPDANTIQLHWQSDGLHAGICINNPLPFSLELKK